MPEIGLSGSMSGEWKRDLRAPAPFLDSTDVRTRLYVHGPHRKALGPFRQQKFASRFEYPSARLRLTLPAPLIGRRQSSAFLRETRRST